MVGKLLTTDACVFGSSQDNGTSDKPDFDVQVCDCVKLLEYRQFINIASFEHSKQNRFSTSE